jgi:nicotinamide mononucleotide (NMN) deamidase PncC
LIERGVLMRKSVLALFVSCALLGCGADNAMHTSPAYALTLNAGPNGKLAADPAGPTYAPRTLVNLTATPDAQCDGRA